MTNVYEKGYRVFAMGFITLSHVYKPIIILHFDMKYNENALLRIYKLHTTNMAMYSTSHTIEQDPLPKC